MPKASAMLSPRPLGLLACSPGFHPDKKAFLLTQAGFFGIALAGRLRFGPIQELLKHLPLLTGADVAIAFRFLRGNEL
jgi:hypothetical protein